MMNKSTALEERYQTLTWGAAQLGIGQGVLDAVAAGLIEATNELIVMVAVWVDPAADDETAVRHACRGATLGGIEECVNGPLRGRRATPRRRARLARQPVLSRRLDVA